MCYPTFDQARRVLSQSSKSAALFRAAATVVSWLLLLTFLPARAAESAAQAMFDNREAALSKATAAVQEASKRAASDTTRPTYHLTAPANWINDPNGPLYYNGKFHLFYQHNPYGDKWDSMHWGHWSSKDLVKWEQQPIALWPSLTLGEDHCFSGCATINAAGEPMIFYTSIGKREPQCWIALPEDKDLVKWRKWQENPTFSESSAGIKYYEFRDPFIFRHNGRTYLLHGGNLNQSKGGQGCVSMFEAENPKLTKWKFKSILFVDKESTNIECPNFFALGNKFVLITSPHRKCDYFVGSFDANAGTFTPESRGVLDAGDFYAPNTLLGSWNRKIMWGWVTGYKPGHGWTGCMTIPRVLSLKDGVLLQQPARELSKLRGKHTREIKMKVTDCGYVMTDNAGDAIELEVGVLLDSAKTAGLRLCRSQDGQRAITIEYDGAQLDVAGTRVPVKVAPGRALELRVFMDKSVLEVYANNGATCVTRVVSPAPGDLGLELFARGGRASFSTLHRWQMNSIWN